MRGSNIIFFLVWLRLVMWLVVLALQPVVSLRNGSLFRFMFSYSDVTRNIPEWIVFFLIAQFFIGSFVPLAISFYLMKLRKESLVLKRKLLLLQLFFILTFFDDFISAILTASVLAPGITQSLFIYAAHPILLILGLWIFTSIEVEYFELRAIKRRGLQFVTGTYIGEFAAMVLLEDARNWMNDEINVFYSILLGILAVIITLLTYYYLRTQFSITHFINSRLLAPDQG